MSNDPPWHHEANALWSALDNLVDMTVEEAAAASSDNEWARPDRSLRHEARQRVVDAVVDLVRSITGRTPT